MTHAHITTWLIALILFIVAISLHKSGKSRVESCTNDLTFILSINYCDRCGNALLA